MATSTAPTAVHDSFPQSERQKLSIIHGPIDPPLVDLTLGELLNLQCLHYGTRECLVIPWTGARWTYDELNHQSSLLAAALLDMGIGVGDRLGIMAGNCEQYAAVFFAATRIGAILVILNNTYTPTEAQYGLKFSGMSSCVVIFFPVSTSDSADVDCKILFTTKTIGRLDNKPLLTELKAGARALTTIILRGDAEGFSTYADTLQRGSRVSLELLHSAERKVLPHLICNLQFTSGTTGLPKAAMLTHQ